jgi:hypothetical protein
VIRPEASHVFAPAQSATGFDMLPRWYLPLLVFMVLSAIALSVTIYGNAIAP